VEGYVGIRFFIETNGSPINQPTGATCIDSEDGDIIMHTSESGTWSYEVNDNNGLVDSNSTTLDSTVISGLNAGTYYVSISQNSLCGPITFVDTVKVENNTPLNAFFSVHSDSLKLVNGSAELQTSNLSLNANTYSWDFGDGITSNLLSPIHFYSSAGTYIVELEIANGICLDNFVTSINVNEKNEESPISIYQNGDFLIIDSDDLELKSNNIDLMDIKGRVIYSIENGIQNRNEINIQNLSNAIYLVRIKMKDGSYSIQKVYLK